MPYTNEFKSELEAAGAGFLPYGGPGPDGKPVIEFVDTFGEYEAEYAMIRKGVGVMLSPHVGVVEVTGGDRLTFLHAMLTNDTKTLTSGQVRRSFFLSKTGRIDADMLVVAKDDKAYLILDRLSAAKTTTALSNYIFSEDAVVKDVSGAFEAIAMHGPAGVALLKQALGVDVAGIEPLTHQTVKTGDGVEMLVLRYDQTGALGLHLIVPAQSVESVFKKLMEPVGGINPDPHAPAGARPVKGRAIGWLAFNTARIEAGSPIYNVDYGPDSLPAETGILHEAVSFKKGCYIGQEIVARMHNLGHPKRVLVGVKFEDDRLPLAGSEVMTTKEEGSGQTVGAITSSTSAPMLSGVSIAFASVKWGKHNPGTQVTAPAEGAMVKGVVQALKFLP